MVAQPYIQSNNHQRAILSSAAIESTVFYTFTVITIREQEQFKQLLSCSCLENTFFTVFYDIYQFVRTINKAHLKDTINRSSSPGIIKFILHAGRSL